MQIKGVMGCAIAPFFMNGAFRIRDDLHDYPYETPSIFVVHIPESER